MARSGGVIPFVSEEEQERQPGAIGRKVRLATSDGGSVGVLAIDAKCAPPDKDFWTMTKLVADKCERIAKQNSISYKDYVPHKLVTQHKPSKEEKMNHHEEFNSNIPVTELSEVMHSINHHISANLHLTSFVVVAVRSATAA